MTGVQALVRLPLDRHRRDRSAGLRTATLLTGYPGSPLGGYDLELARNGNALTAHEAVHRPAVNEELAATAVWGSQVVNTLPGARFDGVVGLWYGKAPGLDRASDAIRHGNLAGVARTGGAIALVGDDPMAKSSTVPSASEGTLAALQMPVLLPGDLQDVLDLGVHGVALSRSCGLWVGMKITTNVADGFATVEVADDRLDPVMVEIQLDGRPYDHVPTMKLIGERLQTLEYSLAHGRLEAARAYSRVNRLNRIVQQADGDRIGLVAGGKTYFDLRQALSDLALSEQDLRRLGVRMLQVRMPFPLDGEVVREFARGLEEIVVIEEKQPFLERLIKDELYNLADRPMVVGKSDEEGRPLVKPDGELGSDSIAEVIAARVPSVSELERVRERLARLRTLPSAAVTAAARAPYFCSGCPHNTSTAQVPDGALVGAGIGCHGMVTLMRPEEVGEVTGLTQMGGEGAQWIGMAPFTDRPHIFQNIGDGTYNHSGSLAMRASGAAGTNITYKLLWNSHIAMTGGQDPVPGLTLENVVREVLAEGAKRVIITTEEPSRWEGADLPPGVEVLHRDRIMEAQRRLAAIEGMTVLVHDQECAAELRRKRKRGQAEEPPMRVLINERVCEGCGDCGVKSNCLSVHPVETEFGRKTRIHQGSCNKDYSCLQGDCPSFLTVIPAGGQARQPRRAAPVGPDGVGPPAIPAVLGDEFGVRIAGIGGTGIVTVAQTLGTAALLDGLHVRGLDQTGLAQKGGPVVSDLKLTAVPVQGANKAAAADCDLYLAADLLVGTSRPNLAAADPHRTIAVICTARVPTGRMVVDTSASFPDRDGLVEGILRRSIRERSVQLDAQTLCTQLFGTDVVANMFLVGAAYQAGALPLSTGAIESAIELNGAAVERNLQAFRRGRQAVADPDGLRRALDELAPPAPPPSYSPRARQIAAGVRAAPGSELERSVALRVAELIDYQDAAYAVAYARDVERVRAVETQRVPGASELSEAVAFFLHKLMSYKDEYEVARLHLDPRLRSEVQAQFGPDAKISWRLHPPLLRAMGMQRKVELGERFETGFRALTRMRRLRGTRLDPFGYTRVRKVERELISEYRALLDHILAQLTADNHDVAVELARLPDLIRGYEEIKLAGVHRYHAAERELRWKLDLVPTAAAARAEQA
jgi:indolepyruvate ferredoxin oxidoreductase